MIDRSAITQYLLNGAGVPAGQMVPQGVGGYSPALQADTYDHRPRKSTDTHKDSR